jgi:hypothetical protein
MRTDDLIAVLAADISPIDPGRSDRRFFTKLAGGAVLALAAMLLFMGTRPDLPAAAALPMFWIKLIFPASLALAALVALLRLSYPGMRLGRAPAAAALPVTALWLFAGVVLLTAPAGDRLALVLGDTWLECPLSIALLSAPALAFTLWAVRDLAPTRLVLAGAAAGLFAGTVAAFVYALHCTEMQATFLAVWYVLGILIPTGAGALLGRRLLRW